jgi:hypothetical protein
MPLNGLGASGKYVAESYEVYFRLIRLMAMLQSQLSPAILPEQTSVPNIASDHLHGSVPSLVHDGTLRGSCNRGSGSVACPQRVARVLGRI